MAKSTPRVLVIAESPTGRNIAFVDNSTKKEMSRAEFVKGISANKYPGYYVRMQGGLKTPVSKPDGNKGNNLG